MMHRVSVLLIAALSLVMPAAPAAPSIPAEVQDASSHVRLWLNTLCGKSEAAIVAALGKDLQEDTWDLFGKSEKRIRYKFGKESTLLLLFQGDAVVKAEIYVMSE